MIFGIHLQTIGVYDSANFMYHFIFKPKQFNKILHVIALAPFLENLPRWLLTLTCIFLLYILLRKCSLSATQAYHVGFPNLNSVTRWIPIFPEIAQREITFWWEECKRTGDTLCYFSWLGVGKTSLNTSWIFRTRSMYGVPAYRILNGIWATRSHSISRRHSPQHHSQRILASKARQ